MSLSRPAQPYFLSLSCPQPRASHEIYLYLCPIMPRSFPYLWLYPPPPLLVPCEPWTLSLLSSCLQTASLLTAWSALSLLLSPKSSGQSQHLNLSVPKTKSKWFLSAPLQSSPLPLSPTHLYTATYLPSIPGDRFVFSIILYRWDHRAYSLLYLAAFACHNYVQNHLHPF